MWVCMARIAGNTHVGLHGQDSKEIICGFCMDRIAGCTYVGLAWTG
jgi:hypothetical protein